MVRDNEEQVIICIPPEQLYKKSNAVWPANATLISAAPDLLAACEQIAQLIDPWEWPVAYRELKDAIAKAKGLTSDK